MFLVANLRQDIRAAKQVRLPRRAILPGIVVCTLFAWLSDYFGRLDLALPAMESIAMLAFVIAVKWKLHGRAWFWIGTAILAGLHAVLVLSVSWTTRWIPAPVIVPFALIDVLAMFLVLAALEELVEGPGTRRT